MTLVPKTNSQKESPLTMYYLKLKEVKTIFRSLKLAEIVKKVNIYSRIIQIKMRYENEL